MEVGDAVQLDTTDLKNERGKTDPTNGQELIFGKIEQHPPLRSPSMNQLTDLRAWGRRGRLQIPTAEVVYKCLCRSPLEGAELEEEVINIDDEEDCQKGGALRHSHGEVVEPLSRANLNVGLAGGKAGSYIPDQV